MMYSNKPEIKPVKTCSDLLGWMKRYRLWTTMESDPFFSDMLVKGCWRSIVNKHMEEYGVRFISGENKVIPWETTDT